MSKLDRHDCRLSDRMWPFLYLQPRNADQMIGKAYWLDYGMSFVDGPAQWRLPIGFQAVFALLLLLQGMVLPDSPRWLIAHGYREEGARVIAMLEDRDSIEHPDVVRVRKEIEESLALESAGGRWQPVRAHNHLISFSQGLSGIANY